MRRESLLFLIPFTLGLAQPLFPIVYYGYITTQCNLNNTHLVAKAGSVEGKALIICENESFCRYGSPTLNGEKLTLPINTTSTVDVQFYIEYGNKLVYVGNDTAKSGDVKELNFTVNQTICKELFSTQSASTTSVSPAIATPIISISQSPPPTPISAPPTETTPSNKPSQSPREEEITPKFVPALEKITIGNTHVQTSTGEELQRITRRKLLIATFVENKELALKIAKKLEQELHIKLAPVKVITRVYLERTPEGREYIIISKIVNASKAIEYIPKSLAKNISYIQVLHGEVLDILIPDPVLLLKTEKGEIEYRIMSDKVNLVKEILTFVASNSSKPSLQPTKIRTTENTAPNLAYILAIFIVLFFIGFYLGRKH